MLHFKNKSKSISNKLIWAQITEINDTHITIKTATQKILKLKCLSAHIQLIKNIAIKEKNAVIIYYRSAESKNKLPEALAIYQTSISKSNFVSLYAEISSQLGNAGY